MFSIRFPAAAAALVLIAAPALADMIDVSGTGYGTSMSKVMPVSEDLILVDARSMYKSFDTGSADNPFSSASGPCFGAMVIDKGTVSGGGMCHYTDGDGDMAVVGWDATGMSPEGRTLGTWTVRGGTGKWASITGGGTFDAGGDGDDYSNMITGELSMN